MLSTVKISLLLLVLSVTLSNTTALNRRPIIGVVSERTFSHSGPSEKSYIAASYVKFLESAGARVVPFLSTVSDDQVTKLFNSVNGILFPGGGVSLNTSDYGHVGSLVFKLAKESVTDIARYNVSSCLASKDYQKGVGVSGVEDLANDNGDYFPLWGTCLGFELLAYLQADMGHSVLTNVDGANLSLPLVFTSAAHSSRLFSMFSSDLMNTVAMENLTFNSHTWAVTTQTFNSNSKLSDFYTVLSTNRDRKGIEFVSSMEAKKYPFYAVQWHPEKNGFEWTPKEAIPHSEHSVAVMQSAANFFVQEARKSSHAFPSHSEEDAALIYQHMPTYTGDHSTFTQEYIFND